VSTRGLSVLVGSAATPPDEAPALAARIARRTLPGEWRAVRLGASSRQVHLLPADGRRLRTDRAFALARALRADTAVEDAEPLVTVPGLEPDPASRQGRALRRRRAKGADAEPLACSADPVWSLALCRVPEAWELPLPEHGAGRAHGEGIVVAHPDTGYTRHPELLDARRLLVTEGYDFVDDDPDPLDPLDGPVPGHGSRTASVIAGGLGPTGGVSVRGIAPRARLVPLRVTRSVVLFDYGALERALYFAADRGMHVVSVSLGGAWGTRALSRAVRYAVRRGVIVLAAAGNYWPRVVAPARLRDVIAVGACNCRREPWVGSSAGPEVDLAAPGESVWCARTDERTLRVGRGSGTSYAVATVAGACALWLAFHGRDRLLRQYGPDRLAPLFREVLCRDGVATPRLWDRGRHGAGILDARGLLAAQLPEATFLPADDGPPSRPPPAR